MALPALAFLALLALALGPSEAHAASGPSPALARILEHARMLMPDSAP
ncbi:hypothetical protein ABT112_32455 [Streptomyces sp. NPDC002055]